jgi:hypothetical protein
MTGDDSLALVLLVIDDTRPTWRGHDHGEEKSDAFDA